MKLPSALRVRRAESDPAGDAYVARMKLPRGAPGRRPSHTWRASGSTSSSERSHPANCCGVADRVASTKLAKKCQGQGSNREARCADRLLNEIRNIAFAGRVDNDVGPSHSTMRSRPRPAPTTAGCRSARRLESSVPGDRSGRMGHPTGSGIQEGGYGPTERLRPTSALSARLDRPAHNRKLSRECYLAEFIE